jgi:hypothetical protein
MAASQLLAVVAVSLLTIASIFGSINRCVTTQFFVPAALASPSLTRSSNRPALTMTVKELLRVHTNALTKETTLAEAHL